MEALNEIEKIPSPSGPSGGSMSGGLGLGSSFSAASPGAPAMDLSGDDDEDDLFAIHGAKPDRGDAKSSVSAAGISSGKGTLAAATTAKTTATKATSKP